MRSVYFDARVRVVLRALSRRVYFLRFKIGKISPMRAASTALASSLLLAGCNVTQTEQVDFTSTQPGVLACSSALGSYALPKTNLRVTLTRAAAVYEDKTDAKTKVVTKSLKTPASTKIDVTTVSHPDRTLQFCLDHASSAFAADTIKIVKSGPFLGSVFVNATDRTVQIVATLLRTAMIAATGNPSYGRSLFGTDAAGPIVDVEFDPFDRAETARVNKMLKDASPEWGYCVYIPKYSFSQSSPAPTAEQYCEDPDRYSGKSEHFAQLYKDYSQRPVDPKTSGLLYRPRVSYPVVINQKPPPSVANNKAGKAPSETTPAAWAIARIQPVLIENISPVLSLGIERAVFSQRVSSFIFKDGALLTACVAKGSEVEGFMEIPLDISRALVALPSQIATVQIGRTQNEAKLAQAQALAINAQNAAIASILTGSTYSSPTGIKDASTTAALANIQTALANLPSGTTVPDISKDSLFSEAARKVCQETP